MHIFRINTIYKRGVHFKGLQRDQIGILRGKTSVEHCNAFYKDNDISPLECQNLHLIVDNRPQAQHLLC